MVFLWTAVQAWAAFLESIRETSITLVLQELHGLKIMFCAEFSSRCWLLHIKKGQYGRGPEGPVFSTALQLICGGLSSEAFNGSSQAGGDQVKGFLHSGASAMPLVTQGGCPGFVYLQGMSVQASWGAGRGSSCNFSLSPIYEGGED